MSPRRVRFEARLFRGESVAFEACTDFRPGDDADVCRCGWLADDHGPTLGATVPLRHRSPAAPAAQRRAS